jgi:tetratricopeptide (TPR) repeat protein
MGGTEGAAMKSIRLLFAVVALAALAGCATAPQSPTIAGAEVFIDSAFKPPSVRIDPQDALAMTPEMQKFADDMSAEIRRKDPRRGLFDALYTRGMLQLDYDTESTRTAAEAFEARRGNCMSLVLMTAAFAQYMNMPVRFNSVFVEDSWVRSGGIYFATGHVNIGLAKPVAPGNTLSLIGDPDLVTIDFLRPEQSARYRSHAVDESTIVAMFLNNRAAESLAKGNLDDAYWWARAAIQTDPRWLAAYNTLAVLYRRKGLSNAAESTLRLVLDREPLNQMALTNLVVVLNESGRSDEAQRHAKQLAQIRPIPPYHYFDQGVAAMQAGDYEVARKLFRKEIARAAYVPEFHFWLGVAHYQLGDLMAARNELAKARENSSTVRDRELYGAKLAWLNEQRGR